MKINIFAIIIFVFITIIILKIYNESDMFQLKCIVSDIDGNKYCVRERNKLELVADLLAKVTNNMKTLVLHMKKNYPERKNIQRLVNNFNPKQIYETLPTSSYTAYSENKGEKLAFCTTTTKKGNKLIDENTLTFVAIHELSHLATKSVGHTEEFWSNFKFLLKEAKKEGIYNPIDYKKNPQPYCGMTITDNPYFDL
jgi:predicted metal-dependent hydrolase|tara:strand:+ start:38 stop:628 length:591 start_codon:yes stop_codon:yes gene_type:complete